MNDESTTVAVLGTGVMGAGIARTLKREGFAVTAWNRSHDKAAPLAADGIRVEQDVVAAVAHADVVLTMLFDAASVVEVMGQAVAALPEDMVWVQSATVGREGIEEIARFAREHDLLLLDAPVLGTRKPAEEGALVVVASGSATAKDRAAAVLEAIGSRTVDVGDEIGAASALKLVVNSWVATLTAAVAQAVSLAQAFDVDPRLFLEGIGGGPTDAPYAHVKGQLMMADDFPTSFAVRGVVKDLGLIVDAAAASGLDTSFLDGVLDVFRRAEEQGLGDDDMAAVHRVLRPGS